MYLLPVGGQDSQWFKNVLKTPTMGLAAHRRKYAGSATPIMEPAAVNGIADEFQAKIRAGRCGEVLPEPGRCGGGVTHVNATGCSALTDQNTIEPVDVDGEPAPVTARRAITLLD